MLSFFKPKNLMYQAANLTIAYNYGSLYAKAMAEDPNIDSVTQLRLWATLGVNLVTFGKLVPESQKLPSAPSSGVFIGAFILGYMTTFPANTVTLKLR